MQAFDYRAPQTLREAVALLADVGAGARVLAGGTDLLVQMRTGRARPARVVDVKRIPELLALEADARGFRIGAAVPAARIAEHAGLRAAWPGVVDAVELIGSAQIQGRASIGGNLCNASPAADTVPALIAADARCLLAGPAGRRELAAAEVVTGPGRTALAPGEFAVALELGRPAPRSADAYLRFIPRSEMDIAVVGAAVWLALDARGRCSDARVALGAVAPRPIAVPEAAAALVGTPVDDAALERLASAARDACDPIDDLRGTAVYRRRVAGVLARRAAAIALARAREDA